MIRIESVSIVGFLLNSEEAIWGLHDDTSGKQTRQSVLPEAFNIPLPTSPFVRMTSEGLRKMRQQRQMETECHGQ